MVDKDDPYHPAHLAHGRWLGKFEPLSEFEKKLVKVCARGEVCKGDEKMPEAAIETNAVIRAEIIRFLALGGDSEHPVHENGVMISGCYITGDLNLDNSENILPISITKSCFSSHFSIINSNVSEIILDGSSLNGFYGASSHFEASLSAKNGFTNKGEFDLVQSILDRDLDLQGSTLYNPDEICLNANGIKYMVMFISLHSEIKKTSNSNL